MYNSIANGYLNFIFASITDLKSYDANIKKTVIFMSSL